MNKSCLNTKSNDLHLNISLNKSITYNNIETAINNFYNKSLIVNKTIFNLLEVEWVSLFELLLLFQWINTLIEKNKDAEIIFPSPNFLHDVDKSEFGILQDHPIKRPMKRRKRALEFLDRIGSIKEINSIYSKSETTKAQIIIDGFIEGYEYNENSDPYDSRILKIASFWDKKELSFEKELSNDNLRNLLKRHSCLDIVDSGMLSTVVIEELASNAIKHGIYKTGNKFNCAWVAARLVKSSKVTIDEMPKFYKPVYRSLLGKHYIELSICDNGPGIFNQLGQYVPSWIYSKGRSVKAAIDFAFDKFSSSSSEFRSDMDSLPRGLFFVFDLIRQYHGILTVRSSGFYMIYDFLTRKKHPRLLGLYNDGGQCKDIGGTAIQIILPQSQSINLSKPQSGIKFPLRTPVVYEVEAPPVKIADFDYKKNIILKEFVNLCQGCPEIPFIIDFSEYNLNKIKHYQTFLYFIKYLIFFQNPNLLWVYSPHSKDFFITLNDYLLLKRDKLIRDDIKNINIDIEKYLNGIDKFNAKITPCIFPNTEIQWLGTTDEESDILNTIWGAGSIELSSFGEKKEIIYQMALENPNLLIINKSLNSDEYVISFRLDNYEIQNQFLRLLKETSLNLCHRTKNVINRTGCYHLPHGEYSNYYVYLKPILKNENFTNKLTRYLISNFYLNKNIKDSVDVEIIIGGTHSAKKLIRSIGQELNVQTLTIDRYLEQIKESLLGERVAHKNAIIVSDVISSGTFVSEISMRLKEERSNVIAVICICDLRNSKYESKIDINIPVISLFRYPIERYMHPNRKKIFEVNPISLRPTVPEMETKRNFINSILTNDQFVDLVNSSKALIPGHIVLGPTHYSYFIDTNCLLSNYCENIWELVLKDMELILKEQGFEIESDFQCLITAEDSNAELFFPELVRKRFPSVEWVQVERIRLTKEGTWQLDRLDPQLDPISSISNKIALIWDDGSNTGGTLIQLIEVVSEFNPKMIIAYCLVNRLSNNRSRFYTRLEQITKGSGTIVKFIANVPMNTFVHSNCPICNREEPTIPPIEEIEQYNKEFKNLNNIQRWNHISAETIWELSRKNIFNKGYVDIDDFLSIVLTVRSSFGYFENHVNISKEKRDHLLKFINNRKYLAAFCYVLNREPQLSYSLMNFQIPNFEERVTSKINDMILNIENTDIYGKEDIIEYIAKRNPEIILKHPEHYFTKLINDPKMIIIFFYNIFLAKKGNKIIKLFDELLEQCRIDEEQIQEYAFLKGLINSCASWVNIKELSTHNDNVKKSIQDLQQFYRSGKPHGEASENGRPLNKIVNYISYYKNSNTIRRREFFNAIYRDWRDYTVKCIEERLLFAFNNLFELFPVALSSTMRDYYDYQSQYGIKRDYLLLQKLLVELKEAQNQKSTLNKSMNEIERSANRIANNIFDEISAPAAKIVKKIPVYIIKHLKQRKIINQPWIESKKIKIIDRINHKEIECLMTSRIFKQIIDRVFLNIKNHNFKNYNDCKEKTIYLPNPTIEIDLEIEDDVAVVSIKSNGPGKYKDLPGHGIRMNKNCAIAFGAKYEVFNEGDWVVNKLSLKRW